MSTNVVSVNEIDLIDRCISILKNDGVIAVPTDTIYGLAALVHSEQAIHRIYEMKGRSFTKPLAMAVGNIDDVFTWSKPTLSKKQLASGNLLPGPVTLMFERQSSLPSIYGLAALVHSEQAIHRIYEMKGRSFTKPLAMAVGNIDDVFTWSKPTLSKKQLASGNLLPGPVTLMFERQSSLPSYFNPNVTNIAIRIPDCQFMIDLAQRLKQPIALTSANISNEPSSVCIEEFQSLWSQVDLVVDAGLLASNDRRGSTIVDLSRKGYFQVQRQGIGYERIVRYLQEECHLQE
ncbi:unnamed protein product [Adineta steineri]|uniref:Threonylcarbamoyl-AMP synthase n=1 Tax=Adineta steineri TaxID=433720 RepID=A0A814GFU6_9BILA|nr:unnamed protein product [Adineta steineri]